MNKACRGGESSISCLFMRNHRQGIKLSKCIIVSMGQCPSASVICNFDQHHTRMCFLRVAFRSIQMFNPNMVSTDPFSNFFICPGHQVSLRFGMYSCCSHSRRCTSAPSPETRQESPGKDEWGMEMCWPTQSPYRLALFSCDVLRYLRGP